MRYKPWKLRQDNAWEDEQPSEQLYINKWHEFLQTPYAKANVPEWFEKLQAVVESQEETCNGHVDVASASTREEWMILADLHTPFNNSSDEQTRSKHDWHQDRCHYTDQQIGEVPTWVSRNTDNNDGTFTHNTHNFYITFFCNNHYCRRQFQQHDFCSDAKAYIVPFSYAKLSTTNKELKDFTVISTFH